LIVDGSPVECSVLIGTGIEMSEKRSRFIDDKGMLLAIPPITMSVEVNVIVVMLSMFTESVSPPVLHT
jgi:hypothetical protein